MKAMFSKIAVILTVFSFVLISSDLKAQLCTWDFENPTDCDITVELKLTCGGQDTYYSGTVGANSTSTLIFSGGTARSAPCNHSGCSIEIKINGVLVYSGGGLPTSYCIPLSDCPNGTSRGIQIDNIDFTGGSVDTSSHDPAC